MASTSIGSRASISLRLAAFYLTCFGTVGIIVPFWPVWLEDRGLDPAQIGAVIAAGFWAKLPANPLVARLADATAQRRRAMIGLALVSLLGYVAFFGARDLWHFFVLSAIVGAAFTSLYPMGDSVALQRVVSHGVDYGRVRLWGSVGFILASLSGGAALTVVPTGLVLWFVIGGVLLTLLTCLTLPDVRNRSGRTKRVSALREISRPSFVLFLVAAAILQSSHGVYYGFASLHWTAAGHSETVVGLLWSEGVAAEVVLFLFGARLASRFSPWSMMALGGLGGVVRWTALAMSTDLWVLTAVQLLHALTFGAVHLGAMRYLMQKVPTELSSTAQSIYAAGVGGVAFGVVVPAAGVLYRDHGPTAFLLGTGLSATGLLLAAWRWRSARGSRGIGRG